jgi:spermidine/putrescine transport system permease protein
MSLRQKTRAAFAIYGVLGYLFLYVPVIMLALFSFNASRTGSLPFTGFTFKWYQELFSDYLVIESFRNSLFVAAVSSVLATMIGTAASFPLVRSSFRFKELVRVVLILPMMIPGLLIGVALLVFLSSVLHMNLSLGTVIIGHIVLTTPFVILVVSSRLADFDKTLEWAAADLGARTFDAFRLITLPLILPGVLAGVLFAFTLSLDEFVVTLFTIGGQSTLPMYVFSQVKFGVNPKVNALATLLLVGSVVILFGVFSGLSKKS